MNVKRTCFVRFLAVAAAAALLVGSLGPVALSAQGAVTIKMATLVPENSSWFLVLKQMGDRWNKASGGKVRLILYGGGTRGDDPNVVSDMRTGALQGAVLTSVGVAELDKSVYAMSIPMAYDSYEEVYAVLEKMRPRLERTLDSKGFVALNWADAGWVHFFTKRPVAVPDDLKKLVLFQWQGDPKSMAIWQAAGFNPKPGAQSELLSGLKTGMFQACSVPPQVAILLRYYEDAKYMTDLNWALMLGATVVTKDAWNRVPADVKPALIQAAQEAGARLRDDIRRSGEKDVAAMKQAGLTVVPVDARAKALWIQTAQTAYPKVRGDFVPPDAFDEAIRYRDEYRKQSAAAAPKK